MSVLYDLFVLNMQFSFTVKSYAIFIIDSNHLHFNIYLQTKLNTLSFSSISA